MNNLNNNNQINYGGINISNISLKAGMIGGFAASFVSSIVLFILTYIALIPEFNYMAIQAMLFGFSDSVLSAWLAYFVIGTFIWGLIYAVIEAYLGRRGNPRGKGVIFGLIISIIIMIVFMPLAGAGFFIAKYGAVAAGIILITDIIFGVVLGHVYELVRSKIQKL